MPLFDLEGGARAEPVTTMRPDDAAFVQVLTVVLEHLPSLLGERLFMTVERGAAATVLGGGAAAVLALDAAGDPVVVQAVPLLTAEHLVVALRGAGRASGTTRRAMAAAYAQGPDHFHRDLATFFDREGAVRSTSSGRTARLVLVCAEIDDDAVEAVSFLSVDAARVQVLTVGIVEGASGRRLLDVSTLRPGELGARETVSLALDGPAVEAGAERATPALARDEPGEQDREPQLLPAFGRSGPVEAVGPVAAPTPGDHTRVPQTPTPGTVPAGGATIVDGVYVPVFKGLPEPLGALPERPGDLPSFPVFATVSVPRAVDLSLPAVPRAPRPETPAAAPVQASSGSGRPPVQPARAAVQPAHLSSLPGPPVSQPAEAGSPDARLGRLARTLDAPLDLVWVRHRRGERLEVVLGLDGLLHAPDGARFGDPDTAARTLSGASTSSGWRVWRAGDSGPSLDELASGPS